MPSLFTSVEPATVQMPPLRPGETITVTPMPVVEAPVTADAPLWLGPCDSGAFGGVTQSMLQKYLSCRERFRVRYVVGLETADRWNHHSGYGNAWHVCEEHHAANRDWQLPLADYMNQQIDKYPLQRDEITKWWHVCRAQFPEYVKHWADHPDVVDRQPLMQEQVFDVPYTLPSKRVVRLRGKFDSVDLIPSQGGIYLQENKTKGDIDPSTLQQQLRFDLQTMLYLVALQHLMNLGPFERSTDGKTITKYSQPLCGVRYNVCRRPFSGGKGSIKQREGKTVKGKVYKTKPSIPDTYVPGETVEQLCERLRTDYIAAEPAYWFFRVISRVSVHDVATFRRQCLDPLLDNLADDAEWWRWCLEGGHDHWDYGQRGRLLPHHRQRHYRMPYGVHSPLMEGGSTEYDALLDSGISSGLRRATKLFAELEEA